MLKDDPSESFRSLPPAGSARVSCYAIAMGVTIQIFGHKKSADTRKAERWFKERRAPVSIVDVTEKGLSPGELRSVAARVGIEALIDREGARYRDKGLKFAAPTGPRIAELLAEDPLLLRVPIVRAGKDATVGFEPATWEAWLERQG